MYRPPVFSGLSLLNKLRRDLIVVPLHRETVLLAGFRPDKVGLKVCERLDSDILFDHLMVQRKTHTAQKTQRTGGEVRLPVR